MLRVGIWAAAALTACGPAQDRQNTPAREPWSNEAEAIFQQAETLKFSLEKLQLEQAHSEAIGSSGIPPRASQPQTEQQQTSE